MAREYSLCPDGLPGELQVVQSSWTGTKVYYRGERLTGSGSLRSPRYSIPLGDGTAEMRLKQDLSGTLTVVFRDREYPLVRPLRPGEWVLCLLPFLLVFVGGVVGGACGGMGMAFVASRIRATERAALKILLAAGVTAVAFAAYMLVGVPLALLFR